MTTNRGASPEARVATMSSTRVCGGELHRRRRRARAARRAGAPVRSIPRRRRRPRGRRARASAAQAWISSVDLPMPGSPPISVAEPGTKPPPATRSSSPMPVTMRGSGSDSPARSSSGKGRPPAAAPRRRRADAQRRRLLDDGVPLAAGIALALPALGDRAAILADVGGARPGHGATSGRIRGALSRRAMGIGPKKSAAKTFFVRESVGIEDRRRKASYSRKIISPPLLRYRVVEDFATADEARRGAADNKERAVKRRRKSARAAVTTAAPADWRSFCDRRRSPRSGRSARLRRRNASRRSWRPRRWDRP